MKKNLIATLVPLVLLLAACGPAPSDQEEATPATTAPVATAPAAPQVEVAPTTMIKAEPAALPDCTPTKVTLRWNVFATHPEIKTVKIYTGGGRLFAHTSATGSQETGPWIRPGSIFVIKNGADDSELETLTIGGPICSE